MQFFFKAIGVTERLRHLCAPRVQNPVYDMLVRKSRRRFSGLRDLNLVFMCVLAVISAALTSYRVISFYIWFPIIGGYLFLPGAQYVRALLKTGFADQMLVTPVSAAAYVNALKRFFLLCALFSAIPFAVYILTFALPIMVMNANLMNSREISKITVSYLFYYSAFLSAVWLVYWSLIAGGGVAAVGCLAVLGATTLFYRNPLQMMGLALWEATPVTAVTVAVFWVWGALISDHLKQRLVEVMSRRSDKPV